MTVLREIYGTTPWPWVLVSVGILSMYLAGRKSWTGWALGVCAQGLWIAYGITTHQYAFIVTAILYGIVYGKNLLEWRRA
jgi:hypothetical protein